MHNLVLGTLLDLCENAKAIAHVNSWRGKDDISAAHLLCDIWRKEEEEIQVPREKTGAISGESVLYTAWLFMVLLRLLIC